MTSEEPGLEKKRRDYIFLLAFMILSFIGMSVAQKFYPHPNDRFTFADFLVTISVWGWYFFLYRTTANFYSNRWIRVGYVSLQVFQLFFNGYVINQSQTLISDLVVQASIGYLANLAGLSVVFYILLKDIFLKKHDLPYALLGATNIYFMIPLIFSYIFSLVAVHDPSLVHAGPLVIGTLLSNCFEYSWYVIAGMDYPRALGEVIQSIGILEAIAGNLFIVFIIGRLMSK